MAEQPARVRVLTYNVFVRPPGINNNGEDYKEERLTDLVARLGDYDVVCFQELFGGFSFRRRRFLARLAEIGFRHQVVAPRPWLWRALTGVLVDGGCAIVSRFAFEESDSLTYPRGVGADLVAAKGALYARIALAGGRKFHIFTTHTQASYATNTGGRNAVNEAARNDQLDLLGRWVTTKVGLREAHGGRDATVVLAGDFNVHARRSPDDGASSEAYEAMTQRLANSLPGHELVDVVLADAGEHAVTVGDATAADGPLETVLTAPYDYGCRQCVDFVFLLRPVGGGRVRVTDARTEAFETEPGTRPYRQLSDHYGVSATFEALQ